MIIENYTRCVWQSFNERPPMDTGDQILIAQSLIFSIQAWLTWKYVQATNKLTLISESQAELLKTQFESDSPKVTLYCETKEYSYYMLRFYNIGHRPLVLKTILLDGHPIPMKVNHRPLADVKISYSVPAGSMHEIEINSVTTNVTLVYPNGKSIDVDLNIYLNKKFDVPNSIS